MTDKVLDVIKWGLILTIAGAVFYVVYPKYYFTTRNGKPIYKCNQITGYASQDIWPEGSKEKRMRTLRDKKKIDWSKLPDK